MAEETKKNAFEETSETVEWLLSTGKLTGMNEVKTKTEKEKDADGKVIAETTTTRIKPRLEIVKKDYFNFMEGRGCPAEVVKAVHDADKHLLVAQGCANVKLIQQAAEQVASGKLEAPDQIIATTAVRAHAGMSTVETHAAKPKRGEEGSDYGVTKVRTKLGKDFRKSDFTDPAAEICKGVAAKAIKK